MHYLCYCILNAGGVLGHDTTVGDFSDLMPYTAAMGDVHIGDECYFGVRATVINGITIAPHCDIGARRCVIKNIDEPGTYVGVPAKKVK